MKNYRLLGLLFFFCGAFLCTATAGERLTVRLIKASQGKKVVDPKLQDAAAFLMENLPYKTFELIDKNEFSLPAKAVKAPLSGGTYILFIDGVQNQLRLRLLNGEREIVETEVRLQDGVPFVLGAFPGSEKKSRMLILLVVH